jgi:hypothetical protein
MHLTGDEGLPLHWIYAPPGALAKAPVVPALTAMASSVKPIMIFLISIVLLHVLNLFSITNYILKLD